jgi:DNA adenine methylase
MPYFGGKIRLADRLVDLMPAHGHYVEPFSGSLSVLLAKPPAPHETANDLDGHLQNFWRVLRERPDDLIRACSLTPHSRGEFADAQRWSRNDFAGVDDVERARLVWVQLTQGRAGVRTASGWRHYQNPSGSSGSMPDYLSGYVARMPPAVRRLLSVSLECRPALEVVSDYGRHPGVLLYVDPPYLDETRSSGVYKHEMGTHGEHMDLAAALRGCVATVMLSGYASPLYEELYDGWHRREIATATGQGGVWQSRTEVIWCNRPFPDGGLFDLIGDGDGVAGTA